MSDLFPDSHEHLVFEEEPVEHVTMSRRAQRSGRSKVKKRRRRRGIMAAVTVLILGALGAGVYFVVLPFVQNLTTPAPKPVTDYPGPGGPDTVQVTVVAGDDGGAIAQKLVDAGVVATEKAFVEAVSANPKGGSIQPGTYKLAVKSSAAGAVKQLLNLNNKVSEKITIPEGYRADQIYAVIAEKLGVSVEEVATAAKDTAAIGLPAVAKGDIEGWLFPDTYEYGPDSTPTSILATMVARTEQILDDRNVAAENRETVLIKASIVEKETRRDEDRAKAARVIENRLKIDMKLQLDSTVAYIFPTGNLETTAQQRASKDRHNTYRYTGLPIGPICSPGAASIDAVLDPTPGKWIYMVVVNPETGEVRFAVTDADHQKNIQLWSAWCKANPDYQGC